MMDKAKANALSDELMCILGLILENLVFKMMHFDCAALAVLCNHKKKSKF